MDRTYIDQHHVADRYLMGQLSDAERAEFEQALLDDPELLSELDIAQAMIDGLRKLKEQGFVANIGCRRKARIVEISR